MRMTEISGKEIINFNNGARLGVVGESDMTIEPDTGKVSSIIIPRRGNLMNFWADRQHIVIPWEAIVKVGHEVIIVDLDQTNLNFHRYSL